MRPISILLLEDNPLDVDLVLKHLQKWEMPFTAEQVGTRDAFQEALTSTHYDVILSDFALPDFDGTDALEMARRLCPYTPFIFVSGMLGEEIAVESLKKGATDYVLKQRLHRLIPAIERALSERRVRAALEETERRYRILVESVKEYAIFSTDALGIVTTWNAGAERILQFTESEILGKPMSLVYTTDDVAVGIAEAEMQTAVALGRCANERWHRRKDGSIFWASGVLMPVYNEMSRLTGFVKVLRDFTDHRKAEEDRQELLHLERAARFEAEQRNIELARANAELQQFAYAVSHDLQEPLRMLTSYSQLLAKNWNGELGGETEACLQFIVEGADRMRQLLQGLREYVEAGRDSEELVVVDTNEVMRKAMQNLESLIVESGAEIICDNLPPVRCRPIHMVQLFQNLLANAIKYRSKEPPRVRVSASRMNAHWLFSVKDNGIGISPEYRTHIFGVFKRLHGREYAGTGIGLAICQKVVERYGGKIWVESEVGKGADFRFTLPAVTGREVWAEVTS